MTTQTTVLFRTTYPQPDENKPRSSVMFSAMFNLQTNVFLTFMDSQSDVEKTKAKYCFDVSLKAPLREWGSHSSDVDYLLQEIHVQVVLYFKLLFYMLFVR